MAERIRQNRLFLLIALLAIWLLAFGYSIVFFIAVEPQGQNAGYGLTRWQGFLGWQGIAGTVSIAIWGVGRSFRHNPGIRHVSAVPLGMALALILLICVVLLGRTPAA